MTPHNPQADDLTGQVALVTGASSGIGRAAAVELARRGADVLLVGRDPGRLDAAVAEVLAVSGGRPVPYRCDFTRLAEVRLLAQRLRDDHERIDIFANNAGGLVGRRTMTPDGFEATIQTNHLAGFLLANLLRDRLHGGRLVNTSSGSHSDGRLDPDDLGDTGRRYHPGRAYGSSKQANILFAREAVHRWPDMFAASFHPGQVRTRFGTGTIAALFFKVAPFLKTPAQGADTLVWLASAPVDRLTPGGYYIKRTLREPAAGSTDPDLAARLWEASAEAVGLHSRRS